MFFRVDCETTGTNKIRLDISDLKIDNREQIEPYLLFNASTYNVVKLWQKDPQMFDHIFAGTNFIFKSMDNATQVEIAKFFAHANYCIKDTLGKIKEDPRSGRSIIEFTKQLGEQYLDLINRTHLLDHYRNYTKTMIKMQDTSTFGTRPQDTKELTFNEEEMRETMVLSCFCKLASPIFGEIINNMPEQIGEDGKKKLPRDKESRCVNFLTALNNEYFSDILNKLQHYIHHIVISLTSKNQDSAAIFYGFTPNTRTSIILSSLLVRNYVSVELEKFDSNIIRYTDTMVRTLSQTQDSSAHKCQVRTRKAPSSMMASDDSNNADQMEVDSLISMGTMDGPILVECAIDDVVSDHRQRIGVMKADFDRCLEFFKSHPICQTPLNMLAITAVFGQDIGGGSGVEMVTSEPYTKLVAILQLIAYNMGFIQLGNFLTATKSVNVKMQLSLEEENFKRQATTLSHYRTCRSKFSKSTVVIGDQVWDKQMAEMLEDLTSSIYLVNTPDYILEQVPEGADQPIGSMFENGDTLIPTIELTEQLCSVIETFNRDLGDDEAEEV